MRIMYRPFSSTEATNRIRAHRSLKVMSHCAAESARTRRIPLWSVRTHSNQIDILTPRLILAHISGDRLITLFEDPENDSVYEDRDYSNPHRELVDHPGPLGWRVPQVKEDASLNKWFLRWMVLRSSKEIVGSTSFHGAPNAEGMVEIGLGVHPTSVVGVSLVKRWWACGVGSSMNPVSTCFVTR